MNREKLARTIRTLRIFIDKSLAIDGTKKITGFHYNKELLEASAYNTYLETIGNKADSLYGLIKDVEAEMIYWSYLDVVKVISKRFELHNKEVMLAFDYTDEDFYGNVQGLQIHGWTGKDAVTGKFKFLTCSIVSDDIPQKIPLISIPISVGHNMAKEISFCLTLIKKLVGEIKLILFDRGFYSKELMNTLDIADYPYLIFVPKNEMIKTELESMNKDETKIINYNYKYYPHKTKVEGETCLAFLKQIFCKKLEMDIDWVFATNVDDINLSEIIRTYKKRWRIENGFKVQDEALIKCKSSDMNIRFFIFVYQQLLQTLWISFFKEEVTFKKFIIEMSKTCTELVTKAEEKNV